MKLNDKVILITGASSGIGLSIAQAMVAQDARLALAARNPERLNDAAQTLRNAGGHVLAVPADVTREADCHALVQAVHDEFGRIDVLINNAGYAPPAGILDTTVEIWEATHNVCLKGVFLMTRAVLPMMLAQDSGAIVNISSVAGKYGFPNRTAYCAAKWGVHGFTEALRAELRDRNIRAYLVCPGSVATSWWDTVGNPQTEEVMERMIRPEEVADAVCYVLTQPDRLQIDEIVIKTYRNPWA